MRKYIIFLLLCVLSSTVMSQTKNQSSNEETTERIYDNNLDAPDYIFRCWQKIRRNLQSDSVLVYCDRMERYYKEHSNEPKSFKGAILAATNRYKYQINTRKSEEDILLYFKKALETSKKYNNEHSYYDSYRDLINYYNNHHMLVRAKKTIDEMLTEAEKTNTPYGLFEASRQLGSFFKQRNQKRLAIDNLRKAVDYSLQRHNIANASVCISLSELYTYQNDSSIYYAHKSLERGNGSKDSLNAFIQLGILYGQRGEKEIFEKHYAVAKKLYSHLQVSPFTEKMPRLEFYNELLNGNYDKARKIADSYRNKVNKYEMLIAYANATNDQLLRLQAEAYVNQYYDSIIESMNQINLAEMQVAYNDRRKAELLKLESEIQLSKLSESEKQKALEQIARERAEVELENQRLQNEYYKKEALNNKLEKELNQEQLANLEAEAKMQRLEEKRNRIIFLSLIGGLTLLLAFTFMIARNRTRQARKEKAYSEKMELMNHELSVANDTQKRFIQNMSHEIRTPLNAICGFSTILADKDAATKLPQEYRDLYAKLINDNTELMLSLVDDILVMGDIENGKYKKQITPQVVHKLIESSMSSIMARVVQGVELRYDDLLPDDFTIKTDCNRTKQVVLNFLTNACKHTSEGEIVITTQLIDIHGNHIPADAISSDSPTQIQDDATLQISVTNSGTPIPKDKAEVIFQRFEKLDDFKQGTGLGLPICREIANLFHGSVYLDTTYSGEGNRFVFEHPLNDKC